MTDTPPASHPDERRRQLLGEIAALGFCLPGSLSTRPLRCGNPRCRCHADPATLHGPYTYWTRKVRGHTVARLLNPEQLARYRPWFENARRLRKLVNELETLSIHTAERDEGWGRK